MTWTGLSGPEAARRLQEDGPNELPTGGRKQALTIALEVVREPMFLLLIACGSLYLLLGDLGEALMLIAFVFVIMGITFYQERKTERALEALRDLSSPRALVIRDGEERRIPGREVVRDDIIVLSEGDRVPADAVLLSSSHMSVDESLLTGESVPVRKLQWDGRMERTPPGGEDLPFVFSGTLVVQGQGTAQVYATGGSAELGKIGKALESVEQEDTLLQKETRAIVRNVAAIGVVLIVTVIVTYGMTRADWLHGFLAGLALAMAILPEEFPVVLTIFLALGAWRLSQKNVLTHRGPTVEMLGSTTVLCVDKTGTLTLNRMTLRELSVGDQFHVITDAESTMPGDFHEVLEYAVLASKPNPVDPMEKAIKSLCDRALCDTEHMHDDWTLEKEYPLSKELLAMSQVWISPTGTEYVIATKGAPEAVADLCHFTDAQMEELTKTIWTMASQGLRIIGVARAGFMRTELPAQQHDFNFEYVGLLGFMDPVRPGVAEAVKECYAAGIRVVMITGDYPGTATRIAEEIGLRSPGNIINGPQLDAMDEDALRRSIGDVSVFARVVPEQKLRIVNALKGVGETVAMTGDGVNDAPALKSAHIGIAMGGRGTDVARESAALVLLDDDFSSIVQGVKMGRRIFDNIKKALAYIVAIHVPIAGMSVLPIFLDWPLVLLPVHIVFLELVIDPACSIVFEAEREEKDVMQRPPRNPKVPLFDRRTLAMSLIQGFVVLAIVAMVFFVSIERGQGEDTARAFAFTTLIVANLGLILTNRSWTRTIVGMARAKNNALAYVVVGAVVFLLLALYTPGLRELFHFSLISILDVAICAGAGLLSILWFELFKYGRGRSTPA